MVTLESDRQQLCSIRYYNIVSRTSRHCFIDVSKVTNGPTFDEYEDFIILKFYGAMHEMKNVVNVSVHFKNRNGCTDFYSDAPNVRQGVQTHTHVYLLRFQRFSATICLIKIPIHTR